VKQGEIIDRIEEEVTKTVDHVEAGKKELTEARKQKSKVQKVCFHLNLQCLIIAASV